MGQAEPAPQNKQRGVIERFKEAYDAAIADARISEAHTATEGWQRLYVGWVNEERDERRALGQRLKTSAGIMEDIGLDENGEKELGEVKKASADLRDRNTAFETQTIRPVRKPVDECGRVINEARAAAHREERDAPLMNVGLEELMRIETSKVARPEWNAETGRVTVAAP